MTIVPFRDFKLAEMAALSWHGCSSRALLLAAALVAPPLAPPSAGAQLRPFEPLAWETLAGDFTASGGMAVLDGQRASLAGEEGRLIEAGTYLLAWRTGRVVLEASGTAWRTFRATSRFADPAPGTREGDGTRRSDAGDHRVATTLRLTPERAPVAAVLRFGTRLPTTDNRVGLERDQTDFFALLGAHAGRGSWSAGVETGVGINGTREPEFEQSDVLVVLGSVRYAARHFTTLLDLAGHADGLRGRAIRGNEELAEIRVGARAGGRRWLQLQLVRGLTEFSPRAGVLIQAGVSR